MKKTLLTGALLLFCISVLSQEEVTFNFSRKKAVAGSLATASIYVNGAEAVKLRNGGSFIYKALLDVTKPVTVLVKSGLSKREITFKLSPDNKCSIETSFSKGMLNLSLVSGGILAPGTGLVSGIKANKKDLSITYVSDQTLASDTIRQQWIAKGGSIMGMSYIGGASFMRLSQPGVSVNGIGGQFSITGTYLNLVIPEFNPGIQTWKSRVLGFSASDQFFSTTTTVEIAGLDPMTLTSFNVNVMISLNGGYTFGVGKFKDETKWRGAAFELTYRPSIIMSIPESGDIDFSFNATGFGFDVNFNSFTSNAAKLAPRAQSKFTFFMLPPIKDLPLYVSVGYGLTFYTKLK